MCPSTYQFLGCLEDCILVVRDGGCGLECPLSIRCGGHDCGTSSSVAAVQASACRAAHDTGLITFAILLETHGLAASAANFVCNLGFVIFTGRGGFELRVKCMRIPLQNDSNGFFSELFVRFVVCARVAIAFLCARHTRCKTLAIPAAEEVEGRDLGEPFKKD